MGKQTQFHMLPNDMEMLLEFVRKRDPVMTVLRSSDSPELAPVLNPLLETDTMTLWNKSLLGSLERELVRRPGGNDYYRIDPSLPTLELWPSRLIEWNQKPALLQGRIYGLWGSQDIERYVKWYQAIARWIRAHFIKSPLRLGGYIGPAAFKWFLEGGILLPMFNPPPTPEWISFVENQHGGGETDPPAPKL